MIDKIQIQKHEDADLKHKYDLMNQKISFKGLKDELYETRKQYMQETKIPSKLSKSAMVLDKSSRNNKLPGGEKYDSELVRYSSKLSHKSQLKLAEAIAAQNAGK